MKQFKINAQIARKPTRYPTTNTSLTEQKNLQLSLWTQRREAVLHLGLEVEEITEEEVTLPNFWATTTTTTTTKQSRLTSTQTST